MARQPQVTRTIITTNVKALCVNTTDKTTDEKEYILPRTYKDTKAVLKALKARYEVDENGNETDVKIVHVISTTEVETLYGMSEDDFIAHAKVLPPRGTKADDATETENN